MVYSFDFPNNWVYAWDSDDDEVLKITDEINTLMDTLENKYPHHNITLDLHLIFAKIYLDEEEEIRTNGKKSKNAKKYLDFILQNDLDKFGVRYLLVKEFILTNEFVTEE